MRTWKTRVYEELVRWSTWYVDACELDGFRLDVLKHIDRGFYLHRLAAMREHTDREPPSHCPPDGP